VNRDRQEQGVDIIIGRCGIGVDGVGEAFLSCGCSKEWLRCTPEPGFERFVVWYGCESHGVDDGCVNRDRREQGVDVIIGRCGVGVVGVGESFLSCGCPGEGLGCTR